MNKTYTLECTGLSPAALVGLIVCALIGEWTAVGLFAAVVAFDLRIHRATPSTTREKQP